MRKILTLILTACVMIFFVACGDDEDIKTEYRHTYAEMALNLPPDYKEMQNDKFDALFTNEEAYVCVSRFSFAGVESDELDASMFPDEVARKYADTNSLSVDIIDYSDYSCFAYTADGYYNLFAFYRSKYAHFVIRFMCVEEKTEKFSPDFFKYASELIFTV